MPENKSGRNAKRAFGTIATFYALVAFEVAYMASPFAVYFYSVYGPGIRFVSADSQLAWLSFFFLPHIAVDTTSTFLNLRNVVGAAVFLTGFVTFCLSATQLYYYKLRQKGAVTGGAYKSIRHPQYLALAVSSFGLLILWPRYLALLLFLALLFTYYFLARAEEVECEKKFGQSYVEYKNRTHMFLPFSVPRFKRFPNLPRSGFARCVGLGAAFLAVAALSVGVASQIRRWSVDSLYTFYSADSAYISVGAIDTATFIRIVETVESDGVKARLNAVSKDENTRYINYVLPSGWYVSEIPMNPVDGAGGHHSPPPLGANQYTIVFTRATLREGLAVNGSELVLNTITTSPVAEARIDLMGSGNVRIEESLEKPRYEGTPVPIF